MSEYHGVQLRFIGPYPGLSTILYDIRCFLDASKRENVIYMLGYGAGLFGWIPRMLKRPLWINMDGLEWKRAKWPWYGKMYLKLSEWCVVKFSNLLIADSDAIRKYLRSKYGGKINCVMVPYGSDIIVSAPSDKSLRDIGLIPGRYYLIVCRLEPENHVREIIEGFQKSATGRKLVIVGNYKTGSSYVRKLLSIADERVKFIGVEFDKERLKALRYHSLAYVHGHSVGGTNPSLLEALGCGNIIVAHDNEFNREVLSTIGYFFKTPQDIPDILASVESLSTTQRNERSEMARAHIHEHYNWDVITDQYYDLLKSLQ
jgi:glycosyltransferase involved in cell wall biosynthesis